MYTNSSHAMTIPFSAASRWCLRRRMNHQNDTVATVKGTEHTTQIQNWGDTISLRVSGSISKKEFIPRRVWIVPGQRLSITVCLSRAYSHKSGRQIDHRHHGDHPHGHGVVAGGHIQVQHIIRLCLRGHGDLVRDRVGQQLGRAGRLALQELRTLRICVDMGQIAIQQLSHSGRFLLLGAQWLRNEGVCGVETMEDLRERSKDLLKRRTPILDGPDGGQIVVVVVEIVVVPVGQSGR